MYFKFKYICFKHIYTLLYELETGLFTVKTMGLLLFIKDLGWGVPLGVRGQFSKNMNSSKSVNSE